MRLQEKTWWKPFAHPRYPGVDFLASDLHSVLGLYAESGYPMARVRDAVVTYNERGDEVEILIEVEEGPAIHVGSWDVRGRDLPWAATVRDKVSLNAGEPLSWPKLEAERDKLSSFYAGKGYALANTSLLVRYHGDSAAVSFEVAPGQPIRVDSIRVEGLRRSRELLVRRELTLKPGGLLSSQGVLISQQRLLATGVFSRARIVSQFPDSSQPRANLIVNVSERRPSWVGAGAGYSSADQIRLLTEWGQRNLTGLGRRLSYTGNLYYSLAPGFRGGGINFKEGLVQLDYLEPWLFSSRTSGEISPRLHWLRENGFDERSWELALTARRILTLTANASLELRNKRVETTEPGVLPRQTTRSLNLDYIDDRRDNVFDPARGRFAEGSATYAGGGLLGGTNQFARLTGTWQGYTSPQRGWVLAARLKVGQITPIGRGPVSAGLPDTLRLSRVPWDERYRLGGGNTIRGYLEGMVGRQDTLARAVGGMDMFLASLEVRFPIVWIMQGALFLDGGNVWADPKEIKLSRFTDGFTSRTYDPSDLSYGMGVGVRFATPVGPFRFDYAFAVGSGARAPNQKSRTLHVALGQAF